ncbi:nucleotidyltransferase domain-containing protein [Arcobacteraceae bacterium]|nr:nucleotidyltransferase domain-containing protein [Arcobacteraceae bacterium]
MYTKEYILQKLKELKPKYKNEGLEILGLIGSYAKNTATEESDIDILYKLDSEKFYRLHDGFKSFSRLTDIKKELEISFDKHVDICTINQNNEVFVKHALKDLVHV